MSMNMKKSITHLMIATAVMLVSSVDAPAADLKDGMKLKTAEGEQLSVKLQDGKVWIVDAKGGTSMVTISNVNQSNGVIHVVDTVLMPAS